MSAFDVISAVITVVALCGYANAKFIRLPDSVGITVVALLISLLTVAVGAIDPALVAWDHGAVSRIDFSALVFHGLLGLLLFAGSLHVNISALRQSQATIVVLATVGVTISTVICGYAFYYGARLLGTPLRLIDCFVFGALISPTDPIAALGLLRRARVSASLLTTIAGEALFNDGTGVVVFSIILAIASGSQSPAPAEVAKLLAREVFGGIAFGFAFGYSGFLLLRSIDSYAVEILITIAMATGGYALADALGVSAPIATVVMGLMIGNRGRAFGMSELTRERLFTFWDLTDNLLNLLLFGLIGFELTALAASSFQYAALAALSIPIALVARFVSVAIPIGCLSAFERFEPGCLRLLTWAGLRGALAIALALALPTDSAARAPIVTATYAIALFSTLVQAMTVEPLARRWTRRAERADSGSRP
ncbi:MAG TPA: sodium:proton antiporter [Steroidobacteraceae bacterium]|jgi:CPA1 family monovalent cation:H+ antiporter|nr:sodium:proton antiporter [Steroidobacteraceae bacterium]